MGTSAILMMIVAIGIVWGGLLAAVLFLRARPQVTDGDWSIDPDDPAGPDGLDGSDDPDGSETGDHRSGDAPLHRDT